jgi:2-iminoacetate synthase
VTGKQIKLSIHLLSKGNYSNKNDFSTISAEVQPLSTEEYAQLHEAELFIRF